MSVPEMKDEPRARPQVVYESTVGMHDVITDCIQLRHLHVERRVVHIVREFQAQAYPCGTEGYTQVRSDTEIHRELRFHTQFVDGNKQRVASLSCNRDVGS